MPTIKDIAKLAGVSHGTASNVLNQRGNVSAEKINRVMKAAKELGYTINPQAQLLRKGFSNRISVFIPFVLKEYYSDFYEGILYGLEKKNFEVGLIYFTESRLKKLIEKENLIIPNTVVFVGYKPNKEIISILKTGAKLLLVDVPNNDYNPMINGGIGFDMNFLNSYNNKKILLVDYDFKIGESFLSSMESRFSNQIEIDYFKVSDLNEIFNLFDSRMKLYDYNLILTIDRKLQSKIQDVRQWLGYSELNNLFSFESKQIIPVKNNFLELDYKLAAKKIVEMIVGKKYEFLELDFEQKIEKSTFKYLKEQKTVKLLTINSPTTKVLEFVTSVFEKETNIKIDIEVLSTSEYDLSLKK